MVLPKTFATYRLPLAESKAIASGLLPTCMVAITESAFAVRTPVIVGRRIKNVNNRSDVRGIFAGQFVSIIPKKRVLLGSIKRFRKYSRTFRPPSTDAILYEPRMDETKNLNFRSIFD